MPDSESTLEKLAKLKNVEPPTFQLSKLTIDDVFDVFRVIQTLTDTFETVEMACYLTLAEFSAENVKYIELRSTPRKVKYKFSCYHQSQFGSLSLERNGILMLFWPV